MIIAVVVILVLLIAIVAGVYFMRQRAQAQVPIEPCTVPPTEPTAPVGPECVDNNPKCLEWAEGGECRTNPGYMLRQCQKSCSTCGKSDTEIQGMVDEYSKLCEDANPNCESWAGSGECEANPGYMLQSCKRSCNVC